MTPALHTPAAPQVPGCHGRPPKQYPAGRICALPGCTTILRRTHAGPVCDPCQDNGRCKQRGSMDRKEREAAVLEYVRPRDGWITSVEMAKALSIPKGTLTGTLGRMVANGKLVSRMPAEGGGYKLRAHSSEGEKSAKTAPDLTPPAPAPVIPPPEQPADVAPASESLPPQAGLAPFAGIDVRTSSAATWIDPDDEIEVLEICVLQLGRLAGPARDRVITYVASRFMVDWPDEKEK